jgi:hypothetical protein
VPPQLAHTKLDGLVDGFEFLIALFVRFLGVRRRFLLEETAGGNPDLVTRWDGFASFIEDGFCALGCFEASEG